MGKSKKSTKRRVSRTVGGEGATALPVRRYFTRRGKSVYDELEWELRDVEINDPKTGGVFRQEGTEFPKSLLLAISFLSVFFRFHH